MISKKIPNYDQLLVNMDVDESSSNNDTNIQSQGCGSRYTYSDVDRVVYVSTEESWKLLFPSIDNDSKTDVEIVNEEHTTTTPPPMYDESLVMETNDFDEEFPTDQECGTCVDGDVTPKENSYEDRIICAIATEFTSMKECFRKIFSLSNNSTDNKDNVSTIGKTEMDEEERDMYMCGEFPATEKNDRAAGIIFEIVKEFSYRKKSWKKILSNNDYLIGNKDNNMMRYGHVIEIEISKELSRMKEALTKLLSSSKTCSTDNKPNSNMCDDRTHVEDKIISYIAKELLSMKEFLIKLFLAE